MSWLFMIFCNAFGWIIFSCIDYIEETWNQDFIDPICIILPFMAAIIYAVRENIHRKQKPVTLKEMFIFSIKWIVTGVIFALPISYLALSNNWIVKQASEGWEHFLNGFEYVVFSFFFIIGALLIIIIWNAVKWIYSKNKRIKES